WKLNKIWTNGLSTWRIRRVANETKKDMRKLFVYSQTSANKGNSNGTFQTGACYRDRFMVKDENKTIIYFQKS
ncbi:12245_t:CDS:2, partial [Dentiscutata heterogama]